MPSRADLELQAAALSVTASNYPNDSKLEQAVIYAKTRQSFAAAVAASGTLTSDNTELTDGDTVTIGSTVYRFKDTMAQAYDVKRNGTTADTTLGNLVKAINASGTPGTEYFAGTNAHPTVSAAAVASHHTVVTATTAGAAGNTIATTETSSHLSWGATTLASGADATETDPTAAHQLSGGANV